MFGLAWRRLWATPVFTVFAVVSLALGVGVTTAIYSVVVSLTRDTMVVPNDDRIGLVVGSDPIDSRRRTWRSLVSRADFEDLGRSSDQLGPLGASAAFYQSLVDGSVSEAVSGEAVTGNYFSYLGIAPHIGRLIQPADDASPARVLVLSHQFWRTRFAADPGILGRTVRIGGEPFEVVGIASENFAGLTRPLQPGTSVWVPLGSTAMFPSGAAPPADPADRRRRQLSVLVELGPARGAEALSTAVNAIASRLDAAFPIDMRRANHEAPLLQPRGWKIQSIAAVGREMDDQFAAAETIIVVIVALVLVVACTNLANLVLARGSSRMHEVAVRRALGASRLRLVAEQLSETAWLAAMGAIGAFVVTRGLLVWFTSASLPVSEASFVQLEPRLDLATLTLAASSVLASLVVFGLAPAIQLTRGHLRSGLAAESGSTGYQRWRTRRTLIAIQVMISLSFFLIAAFAVRAVQSNRARPSGVDVDRLAMGMLNVHLPPWNDARAREAIDRLMALVSSQPGLEGAAVVSGMPFGTNYTPDCDLTRPDRPFLPGRNDATSAPLIAATPSIFKVLGVPIVRGRGFDERDGFGAPDVIVLSRLTASQVFDTDDVVGREVLLRTDSLGRVAPTTKALTVIGIADDTDTTFRGLRRNGAVYLPLDQHYEPLLALVGRTRGDPADIVSSLRTLAQRADPELVLDRTGTATLVITGLSVLLDVISRLAGGLAVLALVLGMAGLFGVLSHLVARRTREMGLRMALGAEPRQIRRLILRDGLQPVVSGLIMGFLVAGALRVIALASNPFTVTDLALFVLAPIPIVIAALVACHWPAHRASRVNPNVALKEL